MARKLLTIALLSLVSTISAHAGQGWEFVRSLKAGSIYQVLSDSDVFVLQTTSDTTCELLVTHDGGATFRELPIDFLFVHPRPGFRTWIEFTCLHFRNSLDGTIGILQTYDDPLDGNTEQPFFLSTSDGGKSFEAAHVDYVGGNFYAPAKFISSSCTTGSKFIALAGITAEAAPIVGNDLEGILLSDDSGTTWTFRNPLGHPRGKRVARLDSLHVFVSATYGNPLGSLSEDAGASFHSVDSILHLTPGAPHLNQIGLCRSIMYGSDSLSMWLSKDFGRTWTVMSGLPATARILDFKGSTGYATGFYSSDEGLSWQLTTTAGTDLQIASENVAYAFDGQGLYKTSSHGLSSVTTKSQHSAATAYPNPAIDHLHIDQLLHRATVIDDLGRRFDCDISIEGSGSRVQLPNVVNGYYLLSTDAGTQPLLISR